MGDPRAIPALARSPAFGIREAVALADLGPAALPEALEVATSPDSDGDRVANGLLALRVMVEVWAGRRRCHGTGTGSSWTRPPCT